MPAFALPQTVIWDVTYACPLRCTHCYSESGRRPARRLGDADQARIVDVLLEMRPRAVLFSGGEPLLVRGLPKHARRLREGGIGVSLFTGGWELGPAMATELVASFDRIHVSIDGADAATHDHIRGRAGSFAGAMTALANLDIAVHEGPSEGRETAQFGIDCVVVRRNFEQMAAYLTHLAPRFPKLGYVCFAPAIPSGLASRATYAATELVTDAQWERLGERTLRDELQALAPASCSVVLGDNRSLIMRPEDVASGRAAVGTMHVEPDGEVRAMPIYEGTIGSLLERDPGELWRLAQARLRHPLVTSALANVRTLEGWARATRQIDLAFAAQTETPRLVRRLEQVA